MSEIGDLLKAGLKSLEVAAGTPVIVWRGFVFPCIHSTAKRGTMLVFGGQEVTVSMSITLRKSVESIAITADSTIYTVDSDALTMDNDGTTQTIAEVAASGTNVQPVPVPGKIMYQGRHKYRIVAVADGIGGAHWEIDLEDWRK